MGAYLAKYFLVLFFFASHFVFAARFCAPFKVHSDAIPQDYVPHSLSDFSQPVSEDLLVNKIGKIKNQQRFPTVYSNWIKRYPRNFTSDERLEWLKCLLQYAQMDTDKDGIPDWSPLVDEQPARTLYPEDDDQDGDGFVNVLDPEPLIVNVHSKNIKNHIPEHLRILRPQVQELQQELFTKFGLLAIDHTDLHSAHVLKALIEIFDSGLPKNFRLKNFRYVYSFSGHDLKRNVAAFHWKAQALSIPGITSYPNSTLSEDLRVGLFAALTHEIGHAVLLEKLTARDLSSLSTRYAGWEPLESTDIMNSFYSASFFTPYTLSKRVNFVSRYSMTNRHEWFAESFSSVLLNKIGLKGHLGPNWRAFLTRYSDDETWFDYRNISAVFRNQIERLLTP